MKKFGSLLIIAGWGVGIGFSPPLLRPQDVPEKWATEYRIGPLDLLEIKVYDQTGKEQINASVRVSEGGKVTLPMLGEIFVEGSTSAEFEKRLIRLLDKYYHNPQASVVIKEHLSKQASVLGAVAKPGFIEIIGRQTLLQTITKAGGLSKDAGKEIIVTRQLPGGTSVPTRILVDSLMTDPEFNIVLEPGDTVFVQVDRPVIIYIDGQVKTPGALQVMSSRIPTLSQAIAQAGGFTERARRGKVIVRRKDASGKEQVFTIDVTQIQKGKKKDFQLEENDIIFVPETWI